MVIHGYPGHYSISGGICTYPVSIPWIATPHHLTSDAATASGFGAPSCCRKVVEQLLGVGSDKLLSQFFTSPNYWGYNTQLLKKYQFPTDMAVSVMWNTSPKVGTSIPTPFGDEANETSDALFDIAHHRCPSCAALRMCLADGVMLVMLVMLVMVGKVSSIVPCFFWKKKYVNCETHKMD